MVLHGKSEVIARFTSITLYPQENIHFSLDTMPAYKELLADESSNTCIPLSYENLFDYMERSLNLEQMNEWIAYLKRRYLFFYFSHLFEKESYLLKYQVLATRIPDNPNDICNLIDLMHSS